MQASLLSLLLILGVAVACGYLPKQQARAGIVGEPPDYGARAVEPYGFSGTMTCANVRYGIKLAVKDAGPRSPDDYNDPCRSGSGPCNEQYKRDFANSRHVKASLVLTDHGKGETLHKLEDLTGEILFWWPGRAEGTLWGTAMPDGNSPKPHRTTSLTGIVIPLKDGRVITSELQIIEYTHRDTGADEIDSVLSARLCEVAELTRENER